VIRILVAEDSPTVRALLVAILESDPELQVVGQATNGREAVEMALALSPDLITMDVHMPVMDGLEATKEIMVQAPTPILVVSSTSSQSQIELSLSAQRAGALMVVPTPRNPLAPDYAQHRDRLVAMVKAMSQVKVVRRWSTSAPHPASLPAPTPLGSASPRLVAIGASTGGPAALHAILSTLPANFPVPIMVVQHIAEGFVAGLAQWLTASCNLHVKVAEQEERLLPRTVYLAPDDRHLGVRAGLHAVLSNAPAIGGFRPSATFLFQSAATVCGKSLLAIILTGMGRDGVAGLHAVRRAGGRVIAQDEATSAVYGMPREAVSEGVTDTVLPLQQITPRIVLELDSGKGR
jgi:two-component system chemotaxis response regulator CheB